MQIGNQMQNHKIETNSGLIYEDGSIWLTLIFIKIIGSDTLWFPLPPSEVLIILLHSSHQNVCILFTFSNQYIIFHNSQHYVFILKLCYIYVMFVQWVGYDIPIMFICLLVPRCTGTIPPILSTGISYPMSCWIKFLFYPLS